MRYSKANWTFPGVNITIPAPTADWSKFNLTNLPGDKTYPVVTTSILLTNNDLTGRGEHLSSLPYLSNGNAVHQNPTRNCHLMSP